MTALLMPYFPTAAAEEYEAAGSVQSSQEEARGATGLAGSGYPMHSARARRVHEEDDQVRIPSADRRPEKRRQWMRR